MRKAVLSAYATLIVKEAAVDSWHRRGERVKSGGER
jgi:hypothetical protein